MTPHLRATVRSRDISLVEEVAPRRSSNPRQVSRASGVPQDRLAGVCNSNPPRLAREASRVPEKRIIRQGAAAMTPIRPAAPHGRARAQMSVIGLETMPRLLGRSGAIRQMAGGEDEATAPVTRMTKATTMMPEENRLAMKMARRTRRQAGRKSRAGGLRRAAPLAAPRLMTPARR